jgi:hypothetical protein
MLKSSLKVQQNVLLDGLVEVGEVGFGGGLFEVVLVELEV